MAGRRVIEGKSRKINNLTERELVRRIARAAEGGKFPQLRTRIGDDAAVLRLPRGQDLVVTTDLCLEGVHFRRDWHTAQSAGRRCLTRGFSDLAAMGARPLACFLSLAIPRNLPWRWTGGFLRGLLELAAQHKVPLAGGDLSVGDRVLADICCVGAVPAGGALLRSDARPGDLIYVTGALGAAAAELARLKTKSRVPHSVFRVPHSKDALSASLGWGAKNSAHLLPQPRIAAGIALRKLNVRIACMDISDGLAMDLDRLCEASGVAAELEAAKIPLADGATLEQALHGGEDYELLFTAPRGAKIPRRINGVAVTRIGWISRAAGERVSESASQRVLLRKQDGERIALPPRGWEYKF